MSSQKGFAPIILIGVIVVLGIIGVYLVETTRMNDTETPVSNPATVVDTMAVNSLVSPSPFASPSTNTSRYDYTGWQTYSDSQAEFSIKYPSTAKVSDKKEGEYAYFTNFRVKVYNDYTGGSRREWLRDKFDSSTYSVTTEDFLVDGVNALIFKASDSGSIGATFVVIPKGNRVYLFSKDSGQESLDEVKKIISSFKFI